MSDKGIKRLPEISFKVTFAGDTPTALELETLAIGTQFNKVLKGILLSGDHQEAGLAHLRSLLNRVAEEQIMLMEGSQGEW